MNQNLNHNSDLFQPVKIAVAKPVTKDLNSAIQLLLTCSDRLEAMGLVRSAAELLVIANDFLEVTEEAKKKMEAEQFVDTAVAGVA